LRVRSGTYFGSLNLPNHFRRRGERFLERARARVCAGRCEENNEVVSYDNLSAGVGKQFRSPSTGAGMGVTVFVVYYYARTRPRIFRAHIIRRASTVFLIPFAGHERTGTGLKSYRVSVSRPPTIIVDVHGSG